MKVLVFSEAFHISSEMIKNLGFFDIVLYRDSQLYIEPKKVSQSSSGFFKDSDAVLTNYFKKTIVWAEDYRDHSSELSFNYAWKSLALGELSGICLGNSKNTILGHGISKTLATSIVKNIIDISRVGTLDPKMFEIMSAFQDGIGVDMISDLLAAILKKEIYEYNAFLIEKMGLSDQARYHDCVEGKEYSLLPNPCFPDVPILLLPRDILSEIPEYEDYEDISEICSRNEEVRNQMSSYLNPAFKMTSEERKNQTLNALKTEPGLLASLLRDYQGKEGHLYDFETDRLGFLSYDRLISPLLEEGHYSKSSFLSCKDFAIFVCNDFKSLIQDHGGWKELGDKRESLLQFCFLLNAHIFAKLNDIHLGREANDGCGPVDFEFTRGAFDTCVVEIKKLSNSGLIHGIEEGGQLDQYLVSHECPFGVYLVIGDSSDETRLNTLNQAFNKLPASNQNKKMIIFIDTKKRPSASHARVSPSSL